MSHVWLCSNGGFMKVHVMYAGNVGFKVKVGELLSVLEGAQQASLATQRNPTQIGYTEYRPHPVAYEKVVTPAAVGGKSISSTAIVTVYDFGVVTVRFVFEGVEDLTKVRDLVAILYNDTTLQVLALDIIAAFKKEYRSKGLISGDQGDGPLEDLFLVEVGEELKLGSGAEQDPLIGEILLCEDGKRPLDPTRVLEDTRGPVKYYRGDGVILSRNGGVIKGGPEDVRPVLAVLDFFNATYVTAQGLDDKLDGDLDRFDDDPGELVSKAGSVNALLSRAAAALEMAVNAHTFLGDGYLADIWELMSRFLHFRGLFQAIKAKLDALKAIQTELSEQLAKERALEEVHRDVQRQWIELVLSALILLACIISLVK